MAAATLKRTKGVYASKHCPVEPESASPQKVKPQQNSKKVRNVNGIFDWGQRKKQPKHAPPGRDILSPKSAGISKTPNVKSGYSKTLHRRGAGNATKQAGSPLNVDALLGMAQGRKVPMFSLGLAEAMEPYVEETSKAWAATLEDHRKQLDAAREGVDHVTGQPINKPGVPNKHDFDELTEQLENLNRPFEEDRVTLLFENPNDATQPILQEIRVGDIRDSCVERCNRQMAKHKKLEKQHAAIEEEIEELKREIIEDASKNNRAAKEFEKQMMAFDRERAQIEAQAQAERVELKVKQDQATEALNKKIKQLFDII